MPGDTSHGTVEQRVLLIGCHNEGDDLEVLAVEDNAVIDANGATDPLNRLPHNIVAFLLRPILKMLNAESIRLSDYDLRVPMFYASPTDNGWAGLVGTSAGTTFGGIHLFALISEFNSHIEWL